MSSIQNGLVEQHLYGLIEELSGTIELLELKEQLNQRALETFSTKIRYLHNRIETNHLHITRIFRKQHHIRCVFGEHTSFHMRHDKKVSENINILTEQLSKLNINN